MRRFHVHISVEDLEQSVLFYSNLFGRPTVQQADYAKWMIDDPRINFAISTRGHETGLNHLGIQVESDEELRGMREQLAAADAGMVSEDAASCCYAKSDKYWITDPQGIAWETFHSLGAIPMFGDSRWDREEADAKDGLRARTRSGWLMFRRICDERCSAAGTIRLLCAGR